MSSSDRRMDTRVDLRVPFRFRVLNNPGATDQLAESINISQRGILFATTLPLKVGTPLEVCLEMPRELARGIACDVKRVARVVHVQANAFFGGQAGIGLRIEDYESGAAASAVAGAGASKARWTS
jgi:hypothetical protein